MNLGRYAKSIPLACGRLAIERVDLLNLALPYARDQSL